MPFTAKRKNELLYYTADGLSATGGVCHAFSTRPGGVSPAPYDSLNLDIRCGDSDLNIQENYRRFCAAVGMNLDRVVLSQQRHLCEVRRVTSADAGKGLWRERDYTGIDALITNEEDLPLTVFSADCGIILLYDSVQRAIGAVHAGWRGCAAGILKKTVEEMTAAYGSNPADLRCAIGPCIGQCCFETDADVPEAMCAALGEAAEPYIERRGVKFHIDLAGLNREWLLQSGVLPGHIEVLGLCTACRKDLFWSHRKMGLERGTQIAMISLNKEVRR
ncbi:MAG: peptidoglycan editing factor PgeF [Oscillospiraceae bacterium]|nr:peptidoglycan editing factor PgeF [Oscillospiraceae bacterium]